MQPDVSLVTDVVRRLRLLLSRALQSPYVAQEFFLIKLKWLSLNEVIGVGPTGSVSL